MATGYTYVIKDGTTTKLEDFVRSCARGFMIECKDSDGPFPRTVKKSNYHIKALTVSRRALMKLASMTPAQVLKFGKNFKKSEIARYKARIEEQKVDLKRYQAMLTKVLDWKAPTEKHTNLRNFMIEQLNSSIDFDCKGDYYQDEIAKLEKKTPFEIYEDALKRAAWQVSYHQKGDHEEGVRTQQRNEWVAALENSLNPTPEPKTKSRKKVVRKSK